MAIVGQQLLTPESGCVRKYIVDQPLNAGRVSMASWFSSTNRSGVIRDAGNTRYLQFNFTGPQLQVIGYTDTADSANNELYIDGVFVKTFSCYGSWNTDVLLAEVSGLSGGEHTVRIYPGSDGKYLDLEGIDIPSTSVIKEYNQLAPRTKTSISAMVIGDRIPFHYKATANAFGIIDQLGTATGTEIPITSSATPDGVAYFYHTGYDVQGRTKLVADRNVQHSISWDTLNTAGVTSGSGLPFDIWNVAPTSWDKTKSVNASPHLSSDGLTVGDLGAYTNYIRTSDAGKKTGKHYFELTSLFSYNTGSNDGRLGIADASTSVSVAPVYSDYFSTSGVRLFGTTIGLALDLDNSKLYKVDSAGVVSLLANLTPGTTYIPTMSSTGPEMSIRANFGKSTFKNSMPVGFSAYDTSHKIIDSGSATMRLLSGGVSATDKDNEWDKIIAESNLNNTIAVGDNSIWNWNNIYTLTSTITPSGVSCRGYNSKDLWTYTPSNNNGAVAGFRPVLLVENLAVVNITKVTPTHLYIKQHMHCTVEANATFNNNPIDFKTIINNIDNDILSSNTARFIDINKLNTGNNTIKVEGSDGGFTSINIVLEDLYRTKAERTFKSYDGGYTLNNINLDGSAKILK